MYLEKDMIPDFRVNISYVILPNMQYLIWFQAKTKCWWFAFSMLRVMQIPSYCSKYRKSCTPFINYIIKSLFLCKSQILSLLVHIYSNACHYLLHALQIYGMCETEGHHCDWWRRREPPQQDEIVSTQHLVPSLSQLVSVSQFCLTLSLSWITCLNLCCLSLSVKFCLCLSSLF